MEAVEKDTNLITATSQSIALNLTHQKAGALQKATSLWAQNVDAAANWPQEVQSNILSNRLAGWAGENIFFGGQWKQL